ncbi:hypothetical protein QBC38DRAFT_461886 [Podospora fimiseda]|uniref:Uncharacterized protein n=1 Tax=Podospora fimiseda TaxID=252190 RepID=A0AAN6YM50_9PEZI|nr:hypothetical protein QBC38DRAFT_461886 [Podospora fimiseda]
MDINSSPTRSDTDGAGDIQAPDVGHIQGPFSNALGIFGNSPIQNNPGTFPYTQGTSVNSPWHEVVLDNSPYSSQSPITGTSSSIYDSFVNTPNVVNQETEYNWGPPQPGRYTIPYTLLPGDLQGQRLEGSDMKKRPNGPIGPLLQDIPMVISDDTPVTPNTPTSSYNVCHVITTFLSKCDPELCSVFFTSRSSLGVQGIGLIGVVVDEGESGPEGRWLILRALVEGRDVVAVVSYDFDPTLLGFFTQVWKNQRFEYHAEVDQSNPSSPWRNEHWNLGAEARDDGHTGIFPIDNALVVVADLLKQQRWEGLHRKGFVHSILFNLEEAKLNVPAQGPLECTWKGITYIPLRNLPNDKLARIQQITGSGNTGNR